VVDVWASWWSCTSSVFPKVGCSGSLTMVGRIWVDGWWMVGYQWILAVVFRLGADIGTASSAASSGLFLSLDHGGCHMLE
jgi:hypothetical protein